MNAAQVGWFGIARRKKAEEKTTSQWYSSWFAQILQYIKVYGVQAINWFLWMFTGMFNMFLQIISGEYKVSRSTLVKILGVCIFGYLLSTYFGVSIGIPVAIKTAIEQLLSYVHHIVSGTIKVPAAVYSVAKSLHGMTQGIWKEIIQYLKPVKGLVDLKKLHDYPLAVKILKLFLEQKNKVLC